MADPFGRPGEWLRCALHAHTTNSDGELAPPLLVAHYEAAGFDVLAITDHWVRTVEPSTERLLVLTGTELDAVVERTGGEAHVLGLGIVADPPREGARLPAVAETVAWVVANDGVAFLAHPYWSGLTGDDLAAEGLAGLEIWNAGCELEVGRGLSAVHWDEALGVGRRLVGIATDDSHHPGLDSGLAWVWVRSTGRTADAVLGALRDGSFYSSTGPRILDVALDGDVVEVACTPAARVTLVAGAERGSSVNAGRSGYAYRADVLETDDEGVTRARLVIPAAVPYARLEVVDAGGGRAWTNALALP